MSNLKTFDADYAPYAFAGNVLDVFRRLRETSLPEIIDPTVITRIGVSEGNASRTIATLQFLKLVDEDYRQTELMENLAKASTDDYPSVLADILHNAYSEVFRIVNLDTANETNIFDAFRGRKPKSQWKRMATLFIGLCQEAGLRSGEPAIIEKASGTRLNSTISTDQKSSINWLEEFRPLFDKLPNKYQPSWNADEKTKWMKAFEALLDLLIEVED